MSINIPNNYVQQYATNIQVLLQQKGSRLRDAVMSGSHIGKQASPVDQVGSVSANKVVGRFNPMGRVDAVVDRRWVLPTDYDLPQLIDSFDKLRLLLDPTSTFVQNAMFAMGRAMDDEIITAFFGTSKTGEQGATSTTFPSGQQIAVNFGAASNVGLSVAKMRRAKRLLMAAEVDVDSDPLFCAVTAAQHDDLLAEVQITSLDFNDKPVLVDGKITRFLGINLIHTERLAVDGSGYRRNPFWAKSGMYLGMWEDIKTDISQRKDIQSLPWQAYCQGTFGSTRLEEKKIIEVKCLES
jgi:hypothetical protein